jgi:hypothetical protein
MKYVIFIYFLFLKIFLLFIYSHVLTLFGSFPPHPHPPPSSLLPPHFQAEPVSALISNFVEEKT